MLSATWISCGWAAGRTRATGRRTPPTPCRTVNPSLRGERLGLRQVHAPCQRAALPVIQRVLDHESIEMTARYTRVADDTVEWELAHWRERVEVDFAAGSAPNPRPRRAARPAQSRRAGQGPPNCSFAPMAAVAMAREGELSGACLTIGAIVAR
jgi:hypothetical protein